MESLCIICSCLALICALASSKCDRPSVYYALLVAFPVIALFFNPSLEKIFGLMFILVSFLLGFMIKNIIISFFSWIKPEKYHLAPEFLKGSLILASGCLTFIIMALTKDMHQTAVSLSFMIPTLIATPFFIKGCRQQEA